MPYLSINGTSIYYELKGNPNSEETIVFFNGSLSSTNSWHFQVSNFEQLGYKILLHDFRGQLMSDKPKEQFSYKNHADDAKELMDYLNIKKAHIIGASYGGIAAQRFAIDYPEKVASLSLINSLSEMDENTKISVKNFIRWSEDIENNSDDKNKKEQYFWNVAPLIYSTDFIKNNIEVLKQRVSSFTNISTDFFASLAMIYKNQLVNTPITNELNKIDKPTLVIWSEKDILTPRFLSEIMANNIPNSDFVIIPEAGHVSIVEKYKTVNLALTGHIVKNAIQKTSKVHATAN